jgi:hypothetical protein
VRGALQDLNQRVCRAAPAPHCGVIGSVCLGWPRSRQAAVLRRKTRELSLISTD